MTMPRWIRTVALLALTCVTVVSGQPISSGWGRRALPYDGQFTFVRLRWQSGKYGVRVSGEGPNMWLHEFPRAERNLMAILDDLTLVDAKTDGSLVLSLDSPDLFKYPVAMMWEPGYWRMTDPEADRLREYLLKGGFVIFNDFELDQWQNFEVQSRRVLPDARWIKLDGTHPIFGSFFRIEEIHFTHPRNHHLSGFTPAYFGLFENNDPAGRLMAIANYNTNLAEFWQVAGTGFFPVDSSNTAFKLGVNYILYGLTH
jgi:uncharacterized protein DUF4159